MNANKQDVGGLPELPEPVGHVHSDYEYCAERPFKNDGWPVSVYEATQVRTYGELCRAEALQRVSENAANMLAMPIEPGTLELCRAAPAGGDVPSWRNFDSAIDAKALATATEIALMWGNDRSQFVSRIQVAVIDAMRWMGDAQHHVGAPAGSGEVEELVHEWRDTVTEDRKQPMRMTENVYLCKGLESCADELEQALAPSQEKAS